MEAINAIDEFPPRLHSSFDPVTFELPLQAEGSCCCKMDFVSPLPLAIDIAADPSLAVVSSHWRLARAV